jgi:hypothetical protein
MRESAKIFVIDLARKYNELHGDFFDHLEDNFGEILPHLLMADYCRTLLSVDAGESWVDALLLELESKYSEIDDDEVSNVIAVSFIENLPAPNSNHPILKKLGYKLCQQYNITFGVQIC